MCVCVCVCVLCGCIYIDVCLYITTYVYGIYMFASVYTHMCLYVCIMSTRSYRFLMCEMF